MLKLGEVPGLAATAKTELRFMGQMKQLLNCSGKI